MSHYEGPSIDHSLISPNGRLSKRAKTAAIARHQAEVDAWWAEKYPEPSDAEKAREDTIVRAASLRLSALNLRALAARGMSRRKFTKAAEEIDAEADEIERRATTTRD